MTTRAQPAVFMLFTRRGCVTDDCPGFLLSLIANESMNREKVQAA
jgi:hypothetical protein